MNGSTVDIEYFSRQMALPSLGLKGQEILAEAKILIIGMGALGNPLAQSLVLGGINHLTIMDKDLVEYSNLHRQSLFTSEDCGTSKVMAAKNQLIKLRSSIFVQTLDRHFVGSNADKELVEKHDLILDATDLFSSKFLIHDICLQASKPLISAAVTGFLGQLHYFSFHLGAPQCWRCLYPSPPKDGCTGSCGQDGILGGASSVMGHLQAVQAIGFLLKTPMAEPFTTYQIQLLRMTIEKFGWDKNLKCQFHLQDEVRVQPAQPEIEVQSQKIMLSEPLILKPYTIIDLRNPWEISEMDRQFFPSATNVPLPQFLGDLEKWPLDQRYLLLCEFGNKSQTAVYQMTNSGYSWVNHLEGGFAGLRSKIHS